MKEIQIVCFPLTEEKKGLIRFFSQRQEMHESILIDGRRSVIDSLNSTNALVAFGRILWLCELRDLDQGFIIKINRLYFLYIFSVDQSHISKCRLYSNFSPK